MTLPTNPQFRIDLGAGKEAAFKASCTYIPPVRSGDLGITQHREDDNPFEAVWNAVAAIMVMLGFDDDGEVAALVASFDAPGDQGEPDA